MNNTTPYLKNKPAKKLTPILEIKSLTKFLDGKIIIDNINLNVYKGEIFALLGPSGCGKSTLLRILAGFENPNYGKIFLDGEDLLNIPTYYRSINMMFQSHALFPHMTVFQNIAFGLKQEKLKKSEINLRTEKMLSLIKMNQYATKKPYQLSGGQCQRVALARSLVKRPKLLLLDEPMGSLDRNLRDRMQFEIMKILKKIEVTCIIVTHDQVEAMTMAKRIAIMHFGRFTQIGKPQEIYEKPKNLYSAQFIGPINVFNGILRKKLKNNLFIVDSPHLINAVTAYAHLNNLSEKINVNIIIRPEKIFFRNNKPSNLKNFEIGKVIRISYLGNISIFYMRLKLGKIISVQLHNCFHLKNNYYPNLHDDVYLCWNFFHCIILSI